MEAIIQNSLKIYDKSKHAEISIEFTNLIFDISQANNEEELRNLMKIRFNENFEQVKHFIYGFGGHHMWIKQKINGKPQQQVIFVKL